LLGVTVAVDRWSAIAVGDTCLFQVRDGALLSSFPYKSSEEFLQRPTLAGTNPKMNSLLAESFQSAEGALRSGDLIVAATDGLSQWLLRSVEQDSQPWHIFMEDADSLAGLCDLERGEHRMRNDDVACAWIRV